MPTMDDTVDIERIVLVRIINYYNSDKINDIILVIIIVTIVVAAVVTRWQ